MKVRDAVRGLVLNSKERVLLMQMQLPGRPKIWLAPGGGVEGGESKHEAIRRELKEELGPIAIEIGAPIWFGEADVPLFSDELIRLRETYFLCRTEAEAFSRAGWTELERQTVLDLRWWSIEDIRDSDEIIYPTSIAAELPPVLAGEIGPAREIVL